MDVKKPPGIPRRLPLPKRLRSLPLRHPVDRGSCSGRRGRAAHAVEAAAALGPIAMAWTIEPDPLDPPVDCDARSFRNPA